MHNKYDNLGESLWNKIIKLNQTTFSPDLAYLYMYTKKDVLHAISSNLFKEVGVQVELFWA